jgi:hypothetical protein
MTRASSNDSLARRGDRSSRHQWNYPSYLYNRSLESLTGQHAREDADKAFLLNTKAAESGMRDAVLAMGWFHLNGVGVEQDTQQARRWYKKSARQGDSRAMFSLGQMACDERNEVDAEVWFRRASDKGHARSLFWLGKLFWRGDGVPRGPKASNGAIPGGCGQQSSRGSAGDEIFVTQHSVIQALNIRPPSQQSEALGQFGVTSPFPQTGVYTNWAGCRIKQKGPPNGGPFKLLPDSISNYFCKLMSAS